MVDKFRNIFRIAKVTLIVTVTNTWPKRGASTVKHIKTRIRISMKLNLLNSLLMISMNDPSLENKAQVRQSGSMRVCIIIKKKE